MFTFSGCSLYELIPGICPHSWAELNVVDATCESKGRKDLVCGICGSEERQTIPQLEHTYGTNWISDSTRHWHKCNTCQLTTHSAEHTFVEDANGEKSCTVCSYRLIEAQGAISFHFMMLGNENAGDCVYIKAGDNDILIDAGSRADSIDDINTYLKQYVTDGKLEYVIVTHADQDHIAGFAKRDGSLFDLYKCGIIIDFPLTNKNTQTYKNYIAERDDETNRTDAVRYSALECYNNEGGAQRIYNLTPDGNVKLEILYNYYYDHQDGDENNYSVCVMFHHGNRQFLFTGDLEKEGEEKLAEFYDFTQVELFKAGHHGSKTSSNECLLAEIQPKICVACCCAGSVEYTDNLENTFPTQAMIDRIAQYTDKIYVPITIAIVQVEGMDTEDKADDDYDNAEEYTILNGNIQVVSDADLGVYVECSNNNTLLKDTEWFQKYRTMPDAWKSVA
jgi:competence protein ComEC